MVYIESDRTDPAFNLALEEYIFETLEPGRECFMLWQNKNTIVVGKYQNTAEEINREYVESRGIRVVRRLSGGGAVYHDNGNLNFTFIVNQDTRPDFNFQLFCIPVVKALQQFGVAASFTGRNDLVIDGKKISGNSQYTRRGRILHHGCIMLDSNLEHVQDALRVKAAKFTSKSVKSVQSRVTTINEHAPRRISMEEFRQALKKEVFTAADMEPYQLTSEDLCKIEELAEKKYRSWEWTYGFFPEYSISREEKLENGLVTVRMEADHGRIRQIRIAGDFFGNRDISELEARLCGLRLDDQLEEKLSGLDLDQYMFGISAAEFARLLK